MKTKKRREKREKKNNEESKGRPSIRTSGEEYKEKFKGAHQKQKQNLWSWKVN